MSYHQSQKILLTDFSDLWGLLDASGKQILVTQNGHNFIAFAGIAIKGAHQGEKVIRIQKDGKEFARIYPCCWRHSTNCYGTRIGGYSESLDLWVR